MTMSVLLFFLSLLPQTALAQSTHAEFEEFGALVVGRWVGEVVLIADWPGQSKKKGETITRYDVYRWIADQRGIEWVEFADDATGTTLIAWEAPSKEIHAFHVGSGGNTWQAVIWKESHYEWPFKVTSGGLPDGRKFAGEGRWIFKDDGDTIVMEGTVILGGETLPKLADVYRRVKKR